MAINVLGRRVMDPFGQDSRTRLWDCDVRRAAASDSGSEHEALHSLVHAFFDCDVSPGASGEWDDSKSDPDGEGWAEDAVDALGDLLRDGGDPSRSRLLADARDVAAELAPLQPSGSAFRRAAMARLRGMGYDAGLCKARWKGTGALAAGNYEYVDVVVGEGKQRYIVDLNFSAEFCVARASEEYERVAAALPQVLVAQPEEVRRVVRMVGEAARRSLRAQGLLVPPWRKGRYMMAKWLGPYRRTVNAVPVSSEASEAGGGAAKCSAVGFAEAKEAASYLTMWP